MRTGPATRRWLAAGGLSVLLAGCVPPPQGSEILVSTTPPGASCTLSRDGKPIATAGPTPAIALVEPSGAAITVTCRRPGFAPATATLAAQQTWPGVDFFAHGTPPFDYPHRVDMTLVPAAGAAR